MRVKRGINCGSGQRPFTSVPDVIEWINVDKSTKHNPDLVCDGAHLPYAAGSVDYFVLHHTLEHEGLGDGDGLIKEAHRVLCPTGSLFIFLPDIRELALKWLNGKIDDYIYVVNLMGAYQGEESDRHRWHYTPNSLTKQLVSCAPWHRIEFFDWRVILGSDFAKDWWILAIEAIK